MTAHASITPNSLPEIPGYSIQAELYTGSKTLVYRGIQETAKRPVVIKILRQEYPSLSELIQFRNQYTITKNLNVPGIVRSLSLEPYKNGYALIMEDGGNISLTKYTQEQPLTLQQVLEIALAMAEILSHLHANRVIHKDIKPANIIIHPETQQIKLIDFSIASLLPKETQELQSPNILEGTLAYLAPEQTGRMNRGIDYRADFYSLGVTLYELLTGQLPFLANDPLEVVYSHIAKNPIPPHELNQNIPLVVSNIILKLMGKNAEDRYQSTLGLKYDLDRCWQQLESTGQIVNFGLGDRDLCDRFTIPEKLYGREKEVQALLNAFERVSNGNTELILVAGFSGIGKTAVVNEVHKPITRQKGYFIKGKFDQFNRNIPLSALVQAFRDLIGQLLSESDVQLQTWKTKILNALGENGQVIIDVIPELERIIGPQPAVPELSGDAAQNRFYLLFKKFIQIFTTPEHPLVMFVDDLQWADLASLSLLKLLIMEACSGYLLLLGAYRDNEVFPAHPLMLTVSEISKTGAKVTTITLDPLTKINVNQLVADTLICTDEISLPLTELVYQKTKGNPFFTTQFLKVLHENHCLKFQPELGYWQCNMTMVRSLAVTDDVVEFMALQLEKLLPETQKTLKLAACIGNQFDLNTLAIICEESPVNTSTYLWKALQDGLILPINENYKFFQSQELDYDEQTGEVKVNYKFLHDRVQQAAYFLIPENERQITHLTIGKLLLKNTSAEWQESKIFEIINQLNIGSGLLVDDQEKEEIAQLNLIAGKKAIQSNAYAAAIEYLSTGIKLLAANSWTTQYELTLSLYESLALATYLNGDFEQTETVTKIGLQHTKTALDQVNIYDVWLQTLIAQQKLEESIRTALDFLKNFNVNLPENPSNIDLEQAFEKMKSNLAKAGLTVNKLLDLPKNQNPNSLAISLIFSKIVSSLFFTNINLLSLTSLYQIELAIVDGNGLVMPFVYACCGFVCLGFNDFESSFAFGQLAIDLLKKLEVKEIRGRLLEVVNGHIRPWDSHLDDTLNNFLEGYQSSLEVGDLEFAGYNATMYCYHSFFAGKELPQLEQTMAKYYAATEKNLKHQQALHWQGSFYQSVLNLLGKAEEPRRLLGEICNEETDIPIFVKQNNYTLLYNIYLNKLILFYLFGDYQSALEYSK